jgi:uncharacterized membrane protein YuzA (DUF378 family)
MKGLHALATILLVVGGLNWGLVGLARFDLVATLVGLQFGEVSILSSIVYVLVGASAVFEAVYQASGSGALAPARATR